MTLDLAVLPRAAPTLPNCTSRSMTQAGREWSRRLARAAARWVRTVVAPDPPLLRTTATKGARGCGGVLLAVLLATSSISWLQSSEGSNGRAVTSFTPWRRRVRTVATSASARATITGRWPLNSRTCARRLSEAGCSGSSSITRAAASAMVAWETASPASAGTRWNSAGTAGAKAWRRRSSSAARATMQTFSGSLEAVRVSEVKGLSMCPIAMT